MQNLFFDKQLIVADDNYSGVSKVIRFNHTEEKILKFEDLINIKANIFSFTQGYYDSSVKKEDVLRKEVNKDLLYKDNPEVTSETLTDNVDYLYLKFSINDKNIASAEVDKLIQSNFGKAHSFRGSENDNLQFIEAYFCELSGEDRIPDTFEL
jgi:hypothetical protein